MKSNSKAWSLAKSLSVVSKKWLAPILRASSCNFEIVNQYSNLPKHAIEIQTFLSAWWEIAVTSKSRALANWTKEVKWISTSIEELDQSTDTYLNSVMSKSSNSSCSNERIKWAIIFRKRKSRKRSLPIATFCPGLVWALKGEKTVSPPQSILLRKIIISFWNWQIEDKRETYEAASSSLRLSGRAKTNLSWTRIPVE